MRFPITVIAAALLACGAGPAAAQLSGGVGSSNAANQSFQNQNSLRGVQQQQNFSNNQNRLQSQTNQMNAGPPNHGPAYAPRRRRH